jgi:hypothetical protein
MAMFLKTSPRQLSSSRITTSEIYKNEEIWCSKNYEGCNDYHIETLINGNMNGDPVFLAGFKPITDLL